MSKKQNTNINIIVEIPKGSSNKYEYDLDSKRIILDRVLHGANFYPGEYGFIENTLDWDGDPLDVLALSTYPTIPGCEVNVRVVGALNMIDDGEKDTKLIGVVNNDPRFNHIQSFADFNEHSKKEIETFFMQYKTLQKKEVKIKGWMSWEETKAEIELTKNLYEEYKHILLKEGKDKVKQIWKEKKLI